VKNLRNGVFGEFSHLSINLDDDEGSASASALSSHVDELCLGSLPAKGFLVGSKTACGASPTQPQPKDEIVPSATSLSPSQRMFPSIDSSRDYDLESNFAPTPAKAFREKRGEPLVNGYFAQDTDEDSDDKHKSRGGECSLPLIKNLSKSQIPSPLKQSIQPTTSKTDKLFIPRDPNKINFYAGGSVASKSNGGPPADPSAPAWSSLKLVQSSPVLVADDKRRVVKSSASSSRTNKSPRIDSTSLAESSSVVSVSGLHQPHSTTTGTSESTSEGAMDRSRVKPPTGQGLNLRTQFGLY
jgi:hypothetical protein